MFALVIPGRPLRSDFTVVDQQRMTITIPQPATVRELTLCLLQPTLPPGTGVAIHFSLPPHTEWNLLGSLTIQNPTVSFRAPWFGKCDASLSEVTLGLAVQDEKTLAQQTSIVEQSESEKTFDSAIGIANNLYAFMQSFNKQNESLQSLQQTKDLLLIPANCIDLWMQKFKHKQKFDPFFFLKKTDSQSSQI